MGDIIIKVLYFIYSLNFLGIEVTQHMGNGHSLNFNKFKSFLGFNLPLFILCSGNQVISAGEDGQVLLWDPRIGREPKVKLKPYLNEQVQRPNLGKFITSVDVENDWLVSDCKNMHYFL